MSARSSAGASMEHRLRPRLPVALPTRLHFRDGGFVAGRTVNISHGGVFIGTLLSGWRDGCAGLRIRVPGGGCTHQLRSTSSLPLNSDGNRSYTRLVLPTAAPTCRKAPLRKCAPTQLLTSSTKRIDMIRAPMRPPSQLGRRALPRITRVHNPITANCPKGQDAKPLA
jgi:hypothetical protein